MSVLVRGSCLASLCMLLIIASVSSLIITTPLNATKSKQQLSVTNLKNLGNKINNLQLPPTSVRFGNVITCSALAPCFGTNRNDIIMSGAGEQVFALSGNDMIYGALNDQLYGGRGNDILLCGAGNCLADGGRGEDVLTAGGGNNLLEGGDGNDKIFATVGDTVMAGGNGANHFDCPSVGRSMVMDYNPSKGDTISGKCTLINTIGKVPTNMPGIDLPDTENTGTATTVAPG